MESDQSSAVTIRELVCLCAFFLLSLVNDGLAEDRGQAIFWASLGTCPPCCLEAKTTESRKGPGRPVLVCQECCSSMASESYESVVRPVPVLLCPCLTNLGETGGVCQTFFLPHHLTVLRRELYIGFHTYWFGCESTFYGM